MGVAPGLPVIPYRVSDTVVLASIELRRNVAMAVRDAVQRQGAEVISISLGFPQLSIFQRFWRSIGVGGIRFDGRIYQTYDVSDHQYVDIWGPAAEIFLAETRRKSGRKVFRTGTSEDEEPVSSGGSVIPSSLSNASASISNRGNGTSYATVHVSAAAALWWQHRGAEIEARYGQHRWQIVEAFRALLKQTARPITPQRGAPTNGTGGLDIAALLDADLPAAATLKREDRLAAGQIF